MHKKNKEGEEGEEGSLHFTCACFKKLSSQFFDLDIENPLGGGALAKIDSSLY